jgi:hypothetical protein
LIPGYFCGRSVLFLKKLLKWISEKFNPILFNLKWWHKQTHLKIKWNL